jgi:uncharacterized membrane protein
MTDMPKKQSHWHFHPHVRSDEDRTTGEKAADVMRHGMGSWPFVFAFVALMTAWMVYNLAVGHHNAFDPYPFILLNLALSTLAGLQGAILLIAAKRADRIAAELAKYHLEVSEATKQMLEEHRQMLEGLTK